jgi:hypothetical protein
MHPGRCAFPRLFVQWYPASSGEHAAWWGCMQHGETLCCGPAATAERARRLAAASRRAPAAAERPRLYSAPDVPPMLRTAAARLAAAPAASSKSEGPAARAAATAAPPRLSVEPQSPSPALHACISTCRLHQRHMPGPAGSSLSQMRAGGAHRVAQRVLASAGPAHIACCLRPMPQQRPAGAPCTSRVSDALQPEHRHKAPLQT